MVKNSKKLSFRILPKNIRKTNYNIWFFENKRLIFAVELQNNRIIQASQKYNQPLNQKQQAILDDWYKIHFAQK